MRALWPLAIALVLSVSGCGTGGPGERSAQVEPGDPTILPRPFSAEQIRDEWVEGLTLVLSRTTPEGESRQRWTVVGADADGADIEYAILDSEGNPTGERRVGRSSWIELRDHASFPVEHSRREPATRDTVLGTLDGWLYTVEDPRDGTVNELFFARALPGAPVFMRMMQDGEVVSSLDMVERRRPD